LQIVIDSRERGKTNNKGTRKGRAKSFYEKNGKHSVEIKQLDTGDFVFENKVVYEYKTVEDFLSSITNKRVFDEATNQTNDFQHSFVIIVGNLKTALDDSWAVHKPYYRGNYQKYIKTMSVRYKGAVRRLRTICGVIEAPTERYAFEEMLKQSEKCLDARNYGNRTHKQVKNQTVVEVVLTSIKNVGNKRAKTVIDTLGIEDITDLIACSAEQFESVPNISKKTANNMYDFIHQSNRTQKQ
jgi:ERCC4-type nuclease